ncbi:MAG: Pol I core factor CF [Claussenomyces sp. TS43310]|nr:MAG: Pol I core factor CF [Claussenomyces sp. TS43310]
MSREPDYHRFPPGEQCTAEGCRSKRYYVLDGLRFCKANGHQQEGYTQIQSDEDDFGTQGRKTRRRREEAPRVARVLGGRAATELFLLCWQLVLRKQVAWLRDARGMPAALETVVRDLWSVRLRGVHGLGGGDRGHAASEASGGAADGGSVGYSSLEALTESEGTAGTRGSTSASVLSRAGVKRRIKTSGLPRLVDTLGLCYLGILLLRLPVSLGDLHRWARREEIVYLRVVREIPKEMRRRLPGYYLAALESRAPLRKDDLHKAVRELVISYKQRFDLVFPPLNAPLILFQHVRHLCLPLEIYAGAQRLGRMLGLSFSFPDHLARHRVTAYPEVQLMALIIIATKLAYPFDDIPRTPSGVGDPSTLSVDWKVWQQLFTDLPDKGCKRGGMIHVRQEDVFKMNGKSLDEYLDWYHKIWIDDRDPKIPQQILDLAPLDELPPPEASRSLQPDVDPTLDRLRKIQSNLIWHQPIPLEAGEGGPIIQRPGSHYKHYRTVQELPRLAKSFYEQAGENAGISLQTTVKAVFQMETQLRACITADQREKSMEEQEDWALAEDDEMDYVS